MFVWEMQLVDVVHSSVCTSVCKRSENLGWVVKNLKGKISNFNFGGVNC